MFSYSCLIDSAAVFRALPEHIVHDMGAVVRHLVAHSPDIFCTTPDFEQFVGNNIDAEVNDDIHYDYNYNSNTHSSNNNHRNSNNKNSHHRHSDIENEGHS
jgi:hypothetical protein